MTIVIGISGPIASGKSTTAKDLRAIFELLGKQAEVKSFAAGIKYLATLYDKPSHIVDAFDYFQNLGYDEHKALRGALMLSGAFNVYPQKNGEKPRKLYQFIGTELGRNTLGEDIWINALKKSLDLTQSGFIIIDDLRFANERAFVNIHIRMVEYTGLSKNVLAARRNTLPAQYIHDDHDSEKQHLDNVSYPLEVEHTTEQLIQIARSILEEQWITKPLTFNIPPKVFSNVYPKKVILSGSYDPTLTEKKYKL